MRPRSDWTDTAPSGLRFNPSEVVGVAIHWQGVPVTRPTPEVLRGDRAYHIGRGWGDIAYNLAVDLNGEVWEARGLDLRSTANGSTAANRTHVAIVFLLGPGQTPTPAMYAGGREAVAIVRARYPHATRIATHNDVRPEPTACPGPELTAAVRNGTLEPTMEEDDMLAALVYIDARYREIVNRPPDRAGLAHWLSRFVAAAKKGPEAVATEADTLIWLLTVEAQKNASRPTR